MAIRLVQVVIPFHHVQKVTSASLKNPDVRWQPLKMSNLVPLKTTPFAPVTRPTGMTAAVTFKGFEKNAPIPNALMVNASSPHVMTAIKTALKQTPTVVVPVLLATKVKAALWTLTAAVTSVKTAFALHRAAATVLPMVEKPTLTAEGLPVQDADSTPTVLRTQTVNRLPAKMAVA